MREIFAIIAKGYDNPVRVSEALEHIVTAIKDDVSIGHSMFVFLFELSILVLAFQY